MLRSGVGYSTMMETSDSDEDFEKIPSKKVVSFTSLKDLEKRYPYFFSDTPALNLSFSPIETTKLGVLRAYLKIGCYRKDLRKDTLDECIEKMFQVISSRYTGPNTEVVVHILFDLILKQKEQEQYRIFRGFKPLAASARLYGFEGDDGEDLTESGYDKSFALSSMLDVPRLSTLILREASMETYIDEQTFSDSE